MRSLHLALVLLLAGCSHRPEVTPVAAPDPRTLVPRLDARIASGQASQAELVMRAQLAHLLDPDDVRVRNLLARAETLGMLPPEGALLACDLEVVARRYAMIEHRCGEVLERFPSHPVAEEAAARIHSLYDQTPDGDARATAALTRLRHRCRSASGYSCAGAALQAIRGELTAAATHQQHRYRGQILRAAGSVQTWRVCGPLAAASADAFRRISTEARRSQPRDSGEVACRERHTEGALTYPGAYSAPGVFSLTSYVHAPQAGAALVHSQLPQNSALWIDDVQVQMQDAWRHPGPGNRSRTIHLSDGWHRVHILTQPGTDRDGVALYVLGGDGGPAIDRVQAALPDRPLGSARAAPPLPTAELLLSAHLDPTARPWDALRLMRLLNSGVHGDGERARQIGEALTAAYPGSGSVLLELTDALRNDPTLPDTLRTERIRAALSETLDHRPGALLARYNLALLDSDERPEEALLRMQQLVTDHPEYPWGQRRLHEMLVERGRPVAARVPLEAALRLAPGETSSALAERFYRGQGMVLPALAMVRRRLATSSSLASSRRAEQLLTEGDPHAALAEFDAIHRRFPDAPDHARVLEIARWAEGRSGVEHRAREHLASFPHDENSVRNLLRVARDHDDGAAVAHALKLGETVRPGSPLWARVRQAQTGAAVEDMFVYDSARLIADFEEELRARPERYRGHSHVYVLDMAARIFNRGWSSYGITHQILRVQSKAAASSLGEAQIPAGAERLVLRVIKADGRVVEPESEHASGETSLSDLAIGDYLELRYLEEYPVNSDDEPLHFRFFFATQVPMYRSVLHLGGPTACIDQLTLLAAGSPGPEEEDHGGQRWLTFRADHTEPFRPEPHAGPGTEVLPHLTVTRNIDATQYARRAARELFAQETTNFELGVFAHDAVRDERDRHRQLQRLVQAVVKRVPVESNETHPIAVLARGQGRRSVLVRAAAREIGLDVRWMGVHRASPLALEDWADTDFGDRFLLATIDGEEIPLLLSIHSVLLGHLPASYRGGEMIDIDPDLGARPTLGRRRPIPDAWIRVEPAEVEIEAELDPSGQLRGKLRNRLHGITAGVLRLQFHGTPRPDVQQSLERWLSQLFPSATILDLAIDGMQDEFGPLDINITFRAPRYARQIADAQVIERFLPDLSLSVDGGNASPGSYLRLANRRSPLYLQPHHERSVLRLQIPDGAQVLSPPTSFTESGPFGTYRQHATVLGNRLTVEREIAMPRTRVTPEQYQELRRLGERIAGRTSTQLVLPPGPGRPPRSSPRTGEQS